jgi:hypothetical protein
MLELEWNQIGPARPQGAVVPPTSMSLNGYVLARDPVAGRTIYVCGTGYNGFGEAWSFDGEQWTKLSDALVNLDGEGKHQGGYDSARGGVVVWRFGTDYESEEHRELPMGALLTASGIEKLAVTGTVEYGKVKTSSSPHGLLAFDPTRAVWVCLTRVGVWELGIDNAWVQRASEAPGVPPKWNEDGWGGAYDPVRKQTVFWMFDHADDVYRFFAWDGATLTTLPIDGIDPDELGGEPLALITVQPTHGLVMFLHDKGTFALGADEAAWTRQEALPIGPPLMKGAHLVWDPSVSGFVAGPGEHEGAGSDPQRLFYKIRARTEEYGVRAEKSPIHEASYSNSKHAVWRGRWYAVSQSCLETWVWDDGSGWAQIVTENDSKAVDWGWTPVTLVATEAALLAVRGDGAVFAFDGAAWTDRGVAATPAFADRGDVSVAAAPDGTVVAWGGRIKSRRLNDSFVLADGAWRQAEAPSRLPADFENIKKEIFVDFLCAYDAALGTVVRFGYADVAIRMNEIWQPFAPPGYDEVVGARDHQHLPLHDPKSGETLLLDLEELRVARFDVGGCVQVATVAAAPLLKKEVEEPLTWRELGETCAFDPGRLVLRAQDKEDRWGAFELDLAPAFAAARALGARTIPAPVPPPPPGATLYRVDGGVQVWSYQVIDTRLEISAGPAAAPHTETMELGSAGAATAEAARLEAARRADGYRRALELDPAALRAMACAWSQKLSLLKDRDEDEDEDEEEEDDEEHEEEDAAPPVIAGRLGGLPSGLAIDRWPRRGDEPMGFLLQLETGDLVPGFAAVAVFCVTDGTATEDEEHNVALLLTAAELAGPETAAPDGVPVMPPRAIAIAAPGGEIDEARMAPLVDRDLSLASALDALQASGDGLQEGHLSDKRGGLPAWVQSPERDADGFVLQLDFDRIRLDDAWDDAGLAGCLFVFVDGEGRATAFWQYT